jgi:hypothetical protein
LFIIIIIIIIITLSSRYNKVHKEIFGEYDYGLPPPLSDAQMSRINMSFKEFLDRNNLSALAPVFALGMTHQGYGQLETTPALYGLWWNTPRLLLGVVELKPVMMVMRGGFQYMWENMIAKDGLDVVYNCEVTAINRNLERPKSEAEEVMMLSAGAKTDSTGRVSFPIEVTALTNGREEVFKADFLILAVPQHLILPAVKDATEEERGLFSVIRPLLRIVSTLYTSAVIRPDEKSSQFYADMLTPSIEGGHRASERVSARAIDHVTPEVLGERRAAIAFQYYYTDHKTDPRPSHETFLEDAQKDGHKDIKIIDTCDWTNYMASYNQDHLNSRFPWKILEMQAKNRTWYCGSSVCFESTEDVVSYNHLLLKTFNME